MPMNAMSMIKVLTLCLLLSGCALTGAIKVKTDLTCYWVEEIRFEDETRVWLETLEWPESFERDMESIGDHNELVQQFCE